MLSLLTVSVAAAAVLIWIVVIHISLSNQHHPLFRVILVLSLGALFWGFDLCRPQSIPHNLMWVAPSIGLIANLWARAVKLDKRTVISCSIGILITGLMVWAVIIPARATDSTIYQLPPKEQLAETAGLPGAPEISADFLRKIRAKGSQ